MGTVEGRQRLRYAFNDQRACGQKAGPAFNNKLAESPQPMNHTRESIGPATAEEYIAGLPKERADQISQLREMILQRLPAGYTEEMGFGMITYVIPLETYPKTYNGHPLMYAALASQKRHMAIYLMNVYGDEETLRWFTEGFTASGKKLDMGKSCVRFKKLDDLPSGSHRRNHRPHAGRRIHRLL